MSGRGRRRGGLWAGVILLVLGVFALQATLASASVQHQRKKETPYRVPVFEVPATNGYRVDVFWIAGRKGKPDKVGVLAWNLTSWTSYTASGQVSDRRVRASLGRFGKVDVSFERRGVRRVRPLCAEGIRSLVDGVWKGAVEFEGEEGFTQAINPELETEPLFHDPWECSTSEADYGTSPGVYLKVYSRYGETMVVQNVTGGPVRYEAFAENRIGRVEVGRMIEVFGPASGFHWSKDLKRATISPPAPFSGTATYRALGGRVTDWKGNLHVDFPGFAGYPLNLGPALTEIRHGDCHVYFPPSDEPHPPFGCE
jgi:hypothetical protein